MLAALITAALAGPIVQASLPSCGEILDKVETSHTEYGRALVRHQVVKHGLILMYSKGPNAEYVYALVFLERLKDFEFVSDTFQIEGTCRDMRGNAVDYFSARIPNR